MLEIKHLITLFTIKQSQSLAKASEQLNLTPSALSHQLKQLETELNCLLLQRKSKPPKFTTEGNTLIKLAEKILPACEQTLNSLKHQHTSSQKKLKIGLKCHSCYPWLLATIADLRQQFNTVEVDLNTAFNLNSNEQLLKKNLDIVITENPTPREEIGFIPLFDYDMKIGVSVNNPLAKKSFLLPQDILEETILTFPVPHSQLVINKFFLTPAGLTVKRFREVILDTVMIELTSNNQGISCLPHWAYINYQASTPVKLLDMGAKGISQALYIACLKTNINSFLIIKFIEIAKSNGIKYLKETTTRRQ